MEFDERSQMREYVNHLVSCVRGSVICYNLTTEGKSAEERAATWEQYNRAFDENILAEVLKLLETKGCGVAEVCLAVMKLLDVAARMMELADQHASQEPLKAWMVSFPKRRDLI